MIYLDSCPVIYAFEDSGDRGNRVRDLLSRHDGEGFAISSLVKLECLVGPMKSGNLPLRRLYEQGLGMFELMPSDDRVYLRAAEYRARFGLKTPDALHLAAALLGGCQSLWTNDQRLAGAAGDFAIAVK